MKDYKLSYGQLSLTSVVEKILRDRIYSHLEMDRRMRDSQQGFLWGEVISTWTLGRHLTRSPLVQMTQPFVGSKVGCCQFNPNKYRVFHFGRSNSRSKHKSNGRSLRALMYRGILGSKCLAS